MKVTQINAYVSPDVYHDGKQELVFPRFREDLAMLTPNNGYAVIAARGLFLKSGDSPDIPSHELEFLKAQLPHREMIVIDSAHGILIVFRHLHASCGLLPVVLPHGSKASVAYALTSLGSRRIAISPAVSALASKHSDAEDIYHHLTDLLYLCSEILDPSADLDFRLHCARIAHLAGCKANVTEFPIGSFPVIPSDLQRWTAFLLCVFLALRGDSSMGTALRLDHADLREFSLKLSHRSEYTRKTPVSHTIYQFLSLPAFAEFHLNRDKDRFTIEAQLQRSHPSKLLHTPIFSPSPLVLCIEIS